MTLFFQNLFLYFVLYNILVKTMFKKYFLFCLFIKIFFKKKNWYKRFFLYTNMINKKVFARNVIYKKTILWKSLDSYFMLSRAIHTIKVICAAG